MQDKDYLSPETLGEVLTLDEVSKILKLSISSIRRMVKRKDNPLPSVNLADKDSQKPMPRVLKTELMNYLNTLEDPRKDV